MQVLRLSRRYKWFYYGYRLYPCELRSMEATEYS